jgi:hypothetical protein
MPATSVTATPFFLVKPKLTLGDPLTNGVFYECAASQIETNVEQEETVIETFCGTFKGYKAEQWEIVITCWQSFGTAGFWNLVRPLVGTSTTFAILPDSSRVNAPDNPEMRGTCRVKAFPFLSAAIGEGSDFELVLAVSGPVTFATTGTLMAREGEEGADTDTAEPLEQAAA